MTLTITVTQEDIDAAKHCANCPVELAILRELPQLNRFRIEVSYRTLSYLQDIWHVLAHLPPEVTDWIRAYTFDYPVGPITFPLLVLDETILEEAHRGVI